MSILTNLRYTHICIHTRIRARIYTYVSVYICDSRLIQISVRGRSHRYPLTKVTVGSLWFQVYEFKEYILVHHKRISDTRMGTYEMR